MHDIKKSLLPPNATGLEKNLDTACTRLGQIPVEIGKQWHPDTCPEHLLPWLAWALSVDEWDEHWSEHSKRAMLKQSVSIHKHKGTVGAVKRALKTLNIEFDFLEWFEECEDIALAPIHSTQPHTFVFIAWANENPYTSNEVFLNPDLYDVLFRVINQVKPARAHFDFLVGAKINADLSLGTASSGWCQVRRLSNETKPVIVPPSKAQLSAGLVTSRQNIQVSRMSQQTTPVQLTKCVSKLSTALHLNNKRYAVSRFYLV
ncbi:phage tail protein I [Pseudoalteromonas denitrificans]|uniref:Phage tail protein, P2 protein I family n=1 Tax=Pseudoalteromonas denitrificans DSM 6059 TaxID=1123010 RepID=A0A1I1PWK9_9GAMM|nr:phage tail protein I [Pseudoalteromonas denitrificans]SFD14052.1 phage tail protein, P2 protein I family [Pseudoalteromonas denitrificans DSM 6059]